MASVTLNSVWLHDADDLSDYVVIRWADMTENPKAVGQRVKFANDRWRWITPPGRDDSVTVSFPIVDRATIDELRLRVGVLQMYRDSRQRKWWGVMSDMSFDEAPKYDEAATLSFTFLRTTHHETPETADDGSGA